MEIGSPARLFEWPATGIVASGAAVTVGSHRISIAYAVVSAVCVCTCVRACMFVRACVMCLQYTIKIMIMIIIKIILYFTQIRHTDDFPSTDIPASAYIIYNLLSMNLI